MLSTVAELDSALEVLTATVPPVVAEMILDGDMHRRLAHMGSGHHVG
jgi:hypothetical protein